MNSVTIIETGLANVASVSAAFRRLEVPVQTTRSVNAIENERYVVLPGVGSFGAGMRTLGDLGMVDAIKRRVRMNSPTLAICLGLQLLCDHSDESPGFNGLGCIKGAVQAFPTSVTSPQFGWNWIANENTSVLGDGGFVYYANSYRLSTPPVDWQHGWSDHGGTFVGCLQRDQVVACQFHPELSGSYGSEILNAWLKGGSEETC
ncbi:MAG: imidazole glycerol phosphate synthase subunit HisH [Bradymonadia bacterium]